MFALKIAEDGRLQYATLPEYAQEGAVIVEQLPEGNIIEYRCVDGEFIHDPLPTVEEPVQATLESRVDELEEALELLLSGVTE